MIKKAVSIIISAIGLLMIVFGIVLYAGKSNIEISKPRTYSVASHNYSLDEIDVSAGAGDYSINSVRFGADFYTYIYKGVKETVDALDGICGQLAWASFADQTIYDGLRVSVDAQNETYAVLSDNLAATSQLTQLVYESSIQQLEKSILQSSIVLFSIGALILVFGLAKMSECITFEKFLKPIAKSALLPEQTGNPDEEYREIEEDKTK